jgi:hypothetical protein
MLEVKVLEYPTKNSLSIRGCAAVATFALLSTKNTVFGILYGARSLAKLPSTAYIVHTRWIVEPPDKATPSALAGKWEGHTSDIASCFVKKWICTGTDAIPPNDEVVLEGRPTVDAR